MIKFNDTEPIYLQILNDLKIKLANKTLQPGQKLDSIRDFSELYNVNPNTIQRVFMELDLCGLTFTQRGIGTYIVEDESIINDLRNQIATASTEKYAKEMISLGYTNNQIIELLELLMGGENNGTVKD